MDFSFSDNKEVSSLDRIPADFRPLYKEGTDGKHILDTENAQVKSAVSAITKLNDSLKIARLEAQGLKGKSVDLGKLSDFGTSPDEILSSFNAKIEELESNVKGNKEAKLNLEKVKEDLAKAHSKDLEAKVIKIEALGKQLDRVMVESVAKTAINDAKGDIELLMPFVIKQVRNVEENGEFKVFVVDGQSDKRFSGVTGEPLSIIELVAEMKSSDKYAKLFMSDQKSGGGMNPNSSQKSLGTQLKNTDTMSSVDKIAEGLKQRGNLTNISR